MANLFWKSPKGTKALLDTPFRTEEEFETTVFTTAELLKDIFLLKRQVRGGNKPGIPDIIGLDREGTVCIIEMKNTEVDADVIPQVLKYAVWAKTNPDSIKSLWLQCDEKPENIAPGWDHLQVRILIIAPTIHRSTLAVVDSITHSVELLEVKRWVEGTNQFLLMHKLEPETTGTRTRPVSGARTYDEAFYKSERNSKSVDDFLRYCHQLEALARKQGWQLEMKFNRRYCTFKAGFPQVFGIHWWGTKSFGFFAKLTRAEAARFTPKPDDYEDRWKNANYKIDPGKTKAEDLLPIFRYAYEKFAGKGYQENITSSSSASKSNSKGHLPAVGRTPALAEYIKGPLKLRARFKGQAITARVRRTGHVRLDGKDYTSPSLAAAAACKRKTCNGWTFWQYERAPGKWALLDQLRK
jgi:hypothetical protein